MTALPFDTLLLEADRAARDGKWRAAYACLQLAAALDPSHAGALTGIGTCLLQLGLPEESLEAFARAIELEPQSPEAHNNLGVALAMAGKVDEAETAYRQALSIDPENLAAWKNLALHHLETNRLQEGMTELAAIVRSHPKDVHALEILARCYDEADDLPSARWLYQRIRSLEPGNTTAADALARLDRSANPAYVARPEHAAKLSAWLAMRAAGVTPPLGALTPTRTAQATAFLGPAEPAVISRFEPAVLALSEAGAPALLGSRLGQDTLDGYQVFIFSRPHASFSLLRAVEACAAAGKTIIVDVDEDFHHMPRGHADYWRLGPGNPPALPALDAALARANLVTTSSAVLAERYRSLASQVVEILPCREDSPLWQQAPLAHAGLHVGLLAAHTHPGDIAAIRSVLPRFLTQFPDATLVLAGSPGLYQAFSNIPENRRLFLPPGHSEDYPFLLAHFDLLLVPLAHHPFNEARSDLPLVEAGLRGIPWIASPNPAFRTWKEGGVLAASAAEWRQALETLAADAERRSALGQAGRRAAVERSRSAAAWMELCMPVEVAA